MLKIIKVQLEEAKGAWPNELSNILWAYQTMAKTLARETSFKLTYDTEAVIPIEVGVTNMRREFLEEEGNGDQLMVNLDCLDEVRTETCQRIAKYWQKMADYYYYRVKLKRFSIGDLIL